MACAAVAGSGYVIANPIANWVASRVPPAYARGRGTDGGACRLQSHGQSKPPSFKVAACNRQMKKAVGRVPRKVGILIGDSHARAMRTVLVRRAAMHHETYLLSSFSGGCVPIYDVTRHWAGRSSVDTRCQRQKTYSRKLLRAGKVEPEFAVISAFWSNYGLLSDDGKTVPSDQREIFVRQFGSTIDELQSRGVERTLIVGPVPLMRAENPTGCVLRAERYRMDPAKVCGMPRSAYEERNGEYMRRLELAVQHRENVRLIDPSKALCRGATCGPIIDGFVVYRDDDHLNDSGVSLLYRAFEDEFDWVFGSSD